MKRGPAPKYPPASKPMTARPQFATFAPAGSFEIGEESNNPGKYTGEYIESGTSKIKVPQGDRPSLLATCLPVQRHVVHHVCGVSV